MLLCTFVAILNFPALLKWHDELGILSEWSPSGSFSAPSIDEQGKTIGSGTYQLLVMPDCDSCSIKSIDYQNIFKSSSKTNWLLVFQTKYAHIPLKWKTVRRNIFVLTDQKTTIPKEWLIKAPVFARASIALLTRDTIAVTVGNVK